MELLVFSPGQRRHSKPVNSAACLVIPVYLHTAARFFSLSDNQPGFFFFFLLLTSVIGLLRLVYFPSLLASLFKDKCRVTSQ